MRLLKFILVANAVSVAIAANGISDQPEIDPVAKFLRLYTAGAFREAAQVLHCPETYTMEAIAADQATIIRTLEVFTKEFGRIKSVKAPSGPYVYVTSTVACGTVPYWKKHPTTDTRIYETVNESGDKGYVVFWLADIDGNQVLSWFHQGLPASASASERIEHVFKLQMAIAEQMAQP